ncbi:MAG TPA: peptidoglycan DD-metalloendopeptidase family protein [Bacillota bacterium]
MRFSRAGLMIMLLFLSFFSVVLVKAPSVLASIQDLEAINNQIADTKEELTKKKRQEKSVLNSLTKAQKELDRIERDLEYLNAKLRSAEQNIAKLEKEMAEIERERRILEEQINNRQNLLNQRLVAAYKYGFSGYLEGLLSARSFADFVSKFEAISYFLRNDLLLLNEVEATREEITAKQKEYEVKKESLQDQRNNYYKLKTQAAKNQEQKVVLISKAKRELQIIQSDRKKLETALDELEKTSKEIEEQIKRKQHSGEALGSGQMIWPVKARISSNFGWRMHPILKKNKFHSGIDLAVPTGTAVAAADSGRVLVSGWNGGYGYFIAIDHGNGISTAYGHNSRLLVKEGDIVTKGQTISLSGNTGLSTGPHLHFEVRKDGKPVNPIPFLP